jgi:hypothetical protein
VVRQGVRHRRQTRATHFPLNHHDVKLIMAPAAGYELVPTSDPSPSRPFRARSISPFDTDEDPEHDASHHSYLAHTRQLRMAFEADPRFNPPPPSPYARAALVAFCIFIVWYAFYLRREIWIDFGMGMGDGNIGVAVDPSY